MYGGASSRLTVTNWPLIYQPYVPFLRPCVAQSWYKDTRLVLAGSTILTCCFNEVGIFTVSLKYVSDVLLYNGYWYSNLSFLVATK